MIRFILVEVTKFGERGKSHQPAEFSRACERLLRRVGVRKDELEGSNRCVFRRGREFCRELTKQDIPPNLAAFKSRFTLLGRVRRRLGLRGLPRAGICCGSPH